MHHAVGVCLSSCCSLHSGPLGMTRAAVAAPDLGLIACNSIVAVAQHALAQPVHSVSPDHRYGCAEGVYQWTTARTSTMY